MNSDKVVLGNGGLKWSSMERLTLLYASWVQLVGVAAPVVPAGLVGSGLFGTFLGPTMMGYRPCLGCSVGKEGDEG